MLRFSEYFCFLKLWIIFLKLLKMKYLATYFLQTSYIVFD